MRYIKNEIFSGYNGEPIKIQAPTVFTPEIVEVIEANVSDIFLVILNNYEPMPGEVLRLQEIGPLGDMLKKFKRQLTIKSMLELTDEEHAVLLKISQWMLPKCPKIIMLSALIILELIEDASKKEPIGELASA